MNEEQFVDSMGRQFPSLCETIEVHLENMRELLAHVLFWDVTREVVNSFTGESHDVDWRGFLEFLDASYVQGDSDVRTVIVTSFLLNLPNPGEDGYSIIECLGPALAEKFKQARPSG